MSSIKISEMQEAESLNDDDLLTIVQEGTNKKITKQKALSDIVNAINNPTYTTSEGKDLSIENTRVGKMNFEFYGDTEQATYTGKNLFNNSITNNLWLNTNGEVVTLNGCCVQKINVTAGERYTMDIKWPTNDPANNRWNNGFL